MPAQLANEDYVEALARVVYYWGYPAVDMFGRTSMWELMKDGPGLMFGVGPGAPVNVSGCIADYLPPTQRIVVTPNNDTFYGAAFVNLGLEPVVVQTPTDVPEGHYWVMQITDVFTNVARTLGSAWGTPGGKFLLVGPDWTGDEAGRLHRYHSPSHQLRRRISAQLRGAHRRGQTARDRGAEPDGGLSAQSEPSRPKEIRL